METNKKTTWWQRTQPAWVTILGSTMLLMALLGSWQVAQSVFASSEATANMATASNQLLPYQGYLTNAQGQPLDGPQTLRVELFDASNGGTSIFDPETHTNVPVTDGLFNIAIGSQTTGGIPATVWNSPVAYLEMTVNGEILDPREEIYLPLLNRSPKVVAGQATAIPASNGIYGNVGISLEGQDFTQTPTVLCSTAGNAGFFWNCHVEYETPNSFTIWVHRLDNSTNWTEVPIRWVAIGE